MLLGRQQQQQQQLVLPLACERHVCASLGCGHFICMADTCLPQYMADTRLPQHSMASGAATPALRLHLHPTGTAIDTAPISCAATARAAPHTHAWHTQQMTSRSSPWPAARQLEPGSLVAAGATVTPGTVVPSGQIWAGSPAKFLRNLTAEEQGFIKVRGEGFSTAAGAGAWLVAEARLSCCSCSCRPGISCTPPAQLHVCSPVCAACGRGRGE